MMTKGDDWGNAYAATLSRIKVSEGGKSKLGMEVLMWVSHAKRLLHVNEFCHALGVKGSEDLDTGNIPKIEAVPAFTLGFVRLRSPRLPFGSSTTLSKSTSPTTPNFSLMLTR